MIIDFKSDKTTAYFFEIIEEKTGKPIQDAWYADDEKAIYRSYNRSNGFFYIDPESPNEIAWTEYYCPIKIRIRSNMGPDHQAKARQILAEFEESYL